MIIYEKSISDWNSGIMGYVVAIIMLLAAIIYVNFILFKPKELPGLYSLIKIVPTLILLFGIGCFSYGSYSGIHSESQWTNGKYQSVQGNIEDLVTEELWVRDGSDAPKYESFFSVDDVKFTSNYYTKDEFSAIMNAYEEQATVKVSYIYTFSSKEPWPWRIEIIE